ncbi:MAG: POTRA domain-containing protein [Terriglobales bacterium]|jgi:outer membrane protein assembly factor BamA
MTRLAPALLCLSILLQAATGQKQPVHSQTASASAYKLIALKVTGTTRYTDQEILAASGLRLGQNAADGDFKEAVQRLGDSGLFSAVVYSFSSSGAGTKLEIQLTDTDPGKLVPAHFDNFVGFTDAELLAALQRSVPLFKQLLPVAGTIPDHVSEALQALLTEKKFPGRVSFLREGDESGGALHGISYRIEEVTILIRSVEFPGASPEQTSLLAAAARRLVGAEYQRARLAAVAKFDLLPLYLARGYLNASFGPSDARVVTQPASDPQTPADLHSEIQVDAILPVTPGKVYSTSAVVWKGNSAIPAADLAPLLHLPLGQPADAVRLGEDVKAAIKLYRSHGYMSVQIKPDAQLDDEKSAVHYDLNVVEGDLYRMGEFEINGLDTQAKARMVEAWTLREGQPYNADYPKKFLEDTRQIVPRGVRWAVTIHEAVNAKDKTVDVEIRFKQQ